VYVCLARADCVVGWPFVAVRWLCVGFAMATAPWLLTGEATRTPRACSPNAPDSSPSQAGHSGASHRRACFWPESPEGPAASGAPSLQLAWTARRRRGDASATAAAEDPSQYSAAVGRMGGTTRRPSISADPSPCQDAPRGSPRGRYASPPVLPCLDQRRPRLHTRRAGSLPNVLPYV